MISSIGLVVNDNKSKAIDAGLSLKAEFIRRGIIVRMGEELKDAKVDLFVILGGDGTVLEAFNQYSKLQSPFLCVNFGTVGFLTAVEIADLYHYLPQIVNGIFQVQERPVMEVTITVNYHDHIRHYSLNDVVIRSGHLHVSRQLLRIDGRDVCQYAGDGLIVATPTGSTGYSLSAGGSIVEPVLEVFIINPLIASKKTLSPLIIGMNHKLEIVLQDRKGKLYIDGRELSLLKDSRSILISSTDLKAKFIVLDQERYFDLLHQRCT